MWLWFVPKLAIFFPKGIKKSKSRKQINHFTDVHGLPCIEKLVSSVEETPEPINTDITGKIPEWINGNFLRNGPGKFEIGNQKSVQHLESIVASAATSHS